MYYFWADVERRPDNSFKIEFEAAYASWEDRDWGNNDVCSYDITDAVKNELKKMGLDPRQSVSDINLRARHCAGQR